MKKLYILMILMALGLVLAACGNDNEEQTEQNGESNVENENEANSSEEEETDTESEATERTLTDAMGNEVTVPAEPQRVIASYLEDYLVALGITPVAQWSVSDGASIQDYLQDGLADVPTIPYDLPLEAVTSFNPDLIIMDSASMVEGNKYDQYSRIAPTYVIGSEQNNDWRDELLEIGKVFGQEEKAEQILADYEAKAAAAKEEIQSSIGDESVAALWLVSNTFYIVSENLSSGDVLYNDLGLTVPNVVTEISESSEANWSEISLEKLAELDADHIFLVNSDKGTGSEMLQDDIWQNIPAVKNGNIYEYESTTSWLYTGPIASTQMIDNILAEIAE
ncbi:iron-hydroxamate ABC transporter substrate-binding protein [Aquibacillus koreensis]|uniref:Iron-hydroxamate ABC transporter substrate-binding protein n=1 Tax=Aquibacillus koreensis TaxID=279446 RepID=A0A9X3WQ57_9BACI|nr:iron-hydroxamate ABC transporter substrate-binding protein [Aquibacillus koreensis]MCT2535499.1 iron-hydroxamate ABC transporter substrate-binding protein [Aquibacillus koreensis]MDC3422688.1 iron-hydroxamate ABC transporter substrate-binding protein [Aquibacillus koreensis]